MREVWINIDGFPRYSVSSFGRVVNNKTGRFLALVRNQWNVIHVGLVRGGIQYKRSLAKLVASHFLPVPPLETFNTPTHLDGDRENNNAENLVWRPDWFAAKYHAQFQQQGPLINEPIRDVDSRQEFVNSWHAAQTYGLMDEDVLKSVLSGCRCWPTYQAFELIRKES